MSDSLKLVIFDVDGTLIDSQADILAAMATGFQGEGLAPPPREAVLSIIGLSLPEAIAKLADGAPQTKIDGIVEGYKNAYTQIRASQGVEASPLYEGIAAVLDHLFERDDLLVAVATGKSRRGLDHVLALHDLTGRFVSEQVSDFHPSKPHPAMVHAALSETGVEAENAVMIGDTSFDMEMGRAAGCKTLAVNWGYHRREVLESVAPDHLIDHVVDLQPSIFRLLEITP